VRIAQADGGVALYVLDDDPRADALIATHADLNPTSLRIWRALTAAESWTTVLDVGANYGEMILGATLPSSARAFAFEPAPGVAACLRASVAAADAPVEVIEKAVGAKTETVELFEDPTWSGTTTATRRQAASASKSRPVQMTRLDDFLAERRRDAHERYLVKIDVEGGERQVLEGFRSSLEEAELATLLVEVAHASDEDLRWMLESFFVHLVARGDVQAAPVAVPVPSLQEFRILQEDESFHAQDAILSTCLLDSTFATRHAPEVATDGRSLARMCAILQAEVGALRALRLREVEQAGALAEARQLTHGAQASADEARRDLAAAHDVIRDLDAQKAALLASRSWRVTRPIRAMSDRLRGGRT
jgi:FkbM family methyltransferase